MADKGSKAGMNMLTGLITIALTILGAVLFFLSYTTGYYIFGQMNSTLITGLICAALIAACASIAAMRRYPDNLRAKLITFFVTGFLAAAAILIFGDRVEGIGNCIVTDYDSGHGGEEAIYMSLVGAGCLLAAVIFNIIGSFVQDGNVPLTRAKKNGLLAGAGVVAAAAIFGTLSLAGPSFPGSAAGTAGGTASGGTYQVTFSQENGNVEGMPDYQFLSADLGMLARMDSRFYIDVTLTLDGAGGYSIVSDAYVVDSGKRVEVGEPSGLGLVCTTVAEGNYAENEDGTVVTSPASHAAFTIRTDTYSAQMKDLMNIDMNGSNEDGEYDSADFPVILDYIPETVWTLAGSDIVTYEKTEEAAEGGTGAAAEKAAEEEPKEEPEEEPAAEDPAADASASGAGSAAGLEVLSDDGATKMVFGADGTYTFIFEQFGIEDAGTYTFEGGVLTLTDANGKETVAEGDPLKFHYTYSQSDQLTGDFTIPAGEMP